LGFEFDSDHLDVKDDVADLVKRRDQLSKRGGKFDSLLPIRSGPPHTRYAIVVDDGKLRS
jgi:hypothetical protein